MTNVTFSGRHAGGSNSSSVSNENNSFINVQYFNSSSEGDSGVSATGHTNYTSNSFDRVQLAQFERGRDQYTMTLIGNTIITDSYDGDSDGLNDGYELDIDLNASDPDTDGDSLSDGWAVMYNGSSGVDPLSTASASELNSDVDMDTLSLLEEEELGTDPENNDIDNDGLSDGYETGIGLSASDPDTDGDNLSDGWAVMYNGSSGVGPLSVASASELNSDVDMDTLSLLEEEELGTDPGNNDSNGDGLNDRLGSLLKADATTKYGDKDQDGLSDFKEYLDLYGIPANTAKYDYNDSSTYGDLLDIYHRFGLDLNKASYLRDTVYSEQNGGFSNYLLWNVTFRDNYVGLSPTCSLRLGTADIRML